MESVTPVIRNDQTGEVARTAPGAPVETSPKSSESDVKAQKAELKALLIEARNTRDMLVGFRAAIENGTFNGHKMLDLAKGLAFLEAILKQNNAHITNLQERLDI